MARKEEMTSTNEALKWSITTHEGSSPSKVELFKKIKEAEESLAQFQSSNPKIQRVHGMLRDHPKFQKYYEPRAVAIGPFHHDKPSCQLAEKFKLALAAKFIKDSGREAEDLHKIIEDNIKTLRDCYDEEATWSYTDEALTELLFLDGCSTLQFIYCFMNNELAAFKIKRDQVAFAEQDLFLLENQLPYKVLKLLMSSSAKKEVLDNAIHDFVTWNISRVHNDRHKTVRLNGGTSINMEDPTHLLELLRTEMLGPQIPEAKSRDPQIPEALIGTRSRDPPIPKMEARSRDPRIPNMETRSRDPQIPEALIGESKSRDPPIHRMEARSRDPRIPNMETRSRDPQIPEALIGESKSRDPPIPEAKIEAQSTDPQIPENNKSKDRQQSFRNIEELKAAGIHVKPSKTSSLRDISFDSRCFVGFLHLPPISVDDSMGPKFLNLIAYEMCPDFQNDSGVTSYICFLDSLIDCADDVKELRSAGVLHNLLGSDQEVADLFNEIGTDLVPNSETYRHIKIKIEKHYKKKWKTWMAQFYHEHFSSPWTILAFLGVLAALGLSSIQTWYTITSPPSACDALCEYLKKQLKIE